MNSPCRFWLFALGVVAASYGFCAPSDPAVLPAAVDAALVTENHSGGVLGQHIEELTITGLSADFKGRFVLRIGGKEIYRSEPSTGSGGFHL